MKTIPLLLAIVVLTSYKSNVDLGNPTIQAVCRATLANGQTVDGFITLGYGGYDGFWMNGIFIDCGDNYKHVIPYTLDFRILIKKSNSEYTLVINSNTSNFGNVKGVYALQWIDNPSPYNSKTTRFEENKTGKFFYQKTQLEKKYKILDSLTLYQELSSSTYLDSNEKLKSIKLKFSEIASLDLLENPGDKWIEEINRKTDKAHEIYNTEESSGDFLEAAWYHDIVSQKLLLENYQKMIEFNNKR